MAEPEEAPISFPIAGMPPPPAAKDPRTAKFEADWAETYNPSPYPVNPGVNTNVVGDYLSGPAQQPKTNWSTEAYAKGIGDMLGSAGQWAHDPTTFSKPFEYGAGYRAQNFERYYAHPAFKQLGFSPFRDNEAVYNSKSGFISEMSRAVPQIFKLTVLGFKDMATEWTSYGGGHNPDTEAAESMKHAMAIGSSSKGGVGGWVTNFGVNMGYTMGIMAEMFTENLIMMGLLGGSAFTNTEALVVPAVLEREALQAGKAWSLLSKLSKSYHRDEAFLDAIRKINSPEAAKGIFKLGTLGQKAFDFVNPLEGTVGFLKNYDKLTAMKLGSWAKTARGAAGLYKDARIINAVASEAKLEGGMRKIEQTEDMVNDFFEKNGRIPEGKDLEDINKMADDAAYGVTMANLPMIFLTDKLVFDKIFEGANPFKHSLRDLTLESAAEGTGQVVIKDAGKLGIHKKWSKEAFKVYANPSRVVAGTLRYTGANLAQGLQETSQDVIQGTLGNYYKQQYSDPTMASMAASLGTGVTEQLSAQGLSTFASGFLMGAAIGGIAGPVTKATTNFTYKMFNPEEYMHAKDRKNAYIENFVQTYNDIAADPRKFESALKGLGPSTTKVKNASDAADEALADNDIHGFINQQDELAFQSVIGFIKRGHFEHLEGLIDDWKKMSPEELSQAWGHTQEDDDAGMDINKRLSNFEKKVRKVKSLYDMSLKDMPNPVDLRQARQEGDPNKIAYGEAWEHYRDLMIFQNFAFERTLDRMTSLKRTALDDPNMGEIPSGEFSAMLSPIDLKKHLLTLKAEIRALKELKTSPDELRQKEQELEHLDAYNVALNTFTERSKKLQAGAIKEGAAVEEASAAAAAALGIMKDSYKSFLKVLGKRHDTQLLDTNLDKSFDKVYDYLKLTMDREQLASAINILSNPQHVAELTQRWIPEVMRNIELEKADLYRSGLEAYFGKLETNALLSELEKIGMAIPIQSIQEIDQEGRMPSEYLDLAANKIVLSTTPRGKEAVEIVNRYAIATGKILKPSKLDAIKSALEKKEPAKPAEPAKKAEPAAPVYTRATPEDQLPKELHDELTAALAKEPQIKGEPKITTVGMLLKKGGAAVDAILAAFNKKVRPGTPPIKAEKVKPPVVATPALTVVYHGAFVDDPDALKEAFPAVHPNEYYHHSTIAFRPTDLSKMEVGAKGTLKIIGRLTTDKVDVLLVENPKSTNPDPHITLSTAEGVQPFVSNKEIEENRDKIVPMTGEVAVTEGYYDGKRDVTAAAIKPAAKATPVKPAPTLSPINPSYQGKIVYFPDGSGKTRFITSFETEHPGLVVEADDVLLQLYNAKNKKTKDFVPIEKKQLNKALFEFENTKGKEKDVKAFYKEAGTKLKALADSGKTVLIGNSNLVPVADLIFFPEKGTPREEQLIKQSKKKPLTIESTRKKVKSKLGKKQVITPFEQEDIAEILLNPGAPLPAGVEETPSTNYMKSDEDIEKRIAAIKNLGDIEQFFADLASSIVDQELDISQEQATEITNRINEIKSTLSKNITPANLPVGTIIKTNAVVLKTADKQLLQGTQMKVTKVEPDGVIVMPMGKYRKGQDYFITNEEMPTAIMGIVEGKEEPAAIVEPDPVSSVSMDANVGDPDLESLYDSLPPADGAPKNPDNDNPENCTNTLPF